MIRPVFLATALVLAQMTPAGAVGSDDDAPPAPTPTTTECAEGLVWDTERATCVPIEQSLLPADPKALIATVRELAYAERLSDAMALLRRAPDQGDSMVLTYMGYITRKTGDMDRGLAHYDRALAMAPDNHLARAYLGLAYLQLGRTDEAALQLAEIRARGGRGGWPEQALARALTSGDATTHDY